MPVFGVVRELSGCEVDETTQHVRQLRVQLEDAVRLSLNLYPLILQHQLIWSSQQQVHLQYSTTLISTHSYSSTILSGAPSSRYTYNTVKPSSPFTHIPLPAYPELPAAGTPTIQYNLNLHPLIL